MKEIDIKRLLFIRALEETSDSGFVASPAAGAFVESESKRSNLNVLVAASERAKLVEKDIARRLGRTVQSFYINPFAGSYWLTFLALTVIFLVGISSNYLNPGQANILINPFLLFLGWHLCVYFLLLIKSTVKKPFGSMQNDQPTAPFLRIFSKALGWMSRLTLKPGVQEKADDYKELFAAQMKYRTYLYRYLGKQQLRRLSLALQIVAVIFAAGVVCGLYLHGLVQFFGFYWESTFISSAGFVEDFTKIIFWPLFSLLGVSFPPIPPSPGLIVPGEQWLHLYAMAAIAYIILPRSIFAIVLALTSHYHKEKYQISRQDPYFIKLFALNTDQEISIVPITFGYTLKPETIQNLHATTDVLFAAGAKTEPLVEIPWGESMVDLSPATAIKSLAVIFNGSQTPEDEIHGRFVNEIIASAQERENVIIVVDTAGVIETARTQRQKLWRQALLKAGAGRTIFIDLSKAHSPSEVESAIIEPADNSG